MSVLNPYSLAIVITEGRFSCVKAANSLGFVSHDALTRQLAKEWSFTPITDWNSLPKEGRAVLDDSAIAKPDSEAIEGVGWIYDSAEAKALPGINMLLALWVVGEEFFVLEVAFPQGESRHELVQDHEAPISHFKWYAFWGKTKNPKARLLDGSGCGSQSV